MESVQPRQRPRILVVTDRAPGYDNGHAMRVANTLDALAAIAEVHVVLLDISGAGDEIGADHYTTDVVRARTTPPRGRFSRLVGDAPTDAHYADHESLRRRIAPTVAQEWDLIWCVRARTEELIHGLGSAPTVVDFDDLNDQLLHSIASARATQRGPMAGLVRRGFELADAGRWRRLQADIADRTAAVLVCKQADVDHLGTPNARVLPNAYRMDPASVVRAADAGRPSRPSIVFAGSLNYPPNRLAVRWFLDAVLPLVQEAVPDVTTTIVSRHLKWAPPVAGSSVVFRDDVDDIGEVLAEASVTIAPLRAGGGTRLKVLESFARGVPMVATPFACEGIDVEDGVDLVLADSAEDFAAGCVRLLLDEPFAEAMARAGRDRAARGGDHERFDSTVREIVEAVIGTDAP